MRSQILGHNFSCALVEALRAQRGLPFECAAYEAHCRRLDDAADHPPQVCVNRLLFCRILLDATMPVEVFRP